MTTRDDNAQSPHNVQLQSLRGIAAMVVLVHHALRTFQPAGWAWNLSEVPLNAEAAVVIFFVLSGYVLSASLIRRGLTIEGIAVFYLRRLFRVYPALWIGIVLGVLYLLAAPSLAAPHLSAWATAHSNVFWFRATTIAGSIAGLDNALLPPAWTITVELCASALLPALVWVMLTRPAMAGPVIVVLAVVSALSGPALRHVPFYLIDFALGATLACLPAGRRLRPGFAVMLLAVALLMFAHLIPLPPRAWWIVSVGEGLVSVVLIAGLIVKPVAWLTHPVLVRLGDWSYSVYLLHLPVAFTVARLVDHAGLAGGDRNVAAVGVAVATVAITVPLSALVYRFVELPGIALGTRVVERWRRRPRRPRIPPAVEDRVASNINETP